MKHYILLMLCIATFKSWKATGILFANRFAHELPVPTMMLVVAFIESFAFFMATACLGYATLLELINNH